MLEDKSIFSSIEDAVDDIKEGKMVVVVDDEDRENEGDLIIAAEKATTEDINFMIKNARGLVCVPITREQAIKAGLDLMVTDSSDRHGTAFTVSVDAREGTTTGISAEERSITARTMAKADLCADDLIRPGHMFPLIAKEGGVLKRTGHTEAAVDLTRLAGLSPSGVICEIVKDDGTMARLPDLIKFCRENDLKLISIKDLIEYRSSNTKLVEKVAVVQLPTAFGDFTAHAYRSLLDEEPDKLHIALVKGEINKDDDVLVRVHSECMTGDVFGSLRCDCGPQLHEAMEMVQKEGNGVILYMRQEGRGIGLLEKLKAYKLQEEGLDTVEANEALGHKPDLRDYGLGAQILKDLGINKLRLITNNPLKVVGLEGYGLSITERVPLLIEPNKYNEKYLSTKENRMGHLLHLKNIIK